MAPIWYHNGTMANLTIKNIPQGLHEELKRRAAANRRSLNGEILAILERGDDTQRERRVGADDVLRRLREVRRQMRGPGLTPEEVDHTIDEGRP